MILKIWIEVKEGTYWENKAVLEEDPKYTNLIEDSMYDTNPIKYISMVSEELKWIVKDKECFDFETGKV